MDELWQRYRSFWIPILVGLGAFLVGLIVVHVMTEDPDVLAKAVVGNKRIVEDLVEPSRDEERNVPQNVEDLRKRVTDWASRLDQAGGQDELDSAVTTCLTAAILRGQSPDAIRQAVAKPDGEGAPAVLAAFEGDAVAAAQAVHRYEQARADLLTSLRTGDPNVGFTLLLGAVWSEMKVRANRADVEIKPDYLGFSSVSSVTRPNLPQRLLNLALVSELADLAIRSGARSIEEVRIDPRPAVESTDTFLRTWPFTMSIKGDAASVAPILARLTDPTRPVPLSAVDIKQPPKGSPLDGVVQLSVTAASTLVRPEVSLGLQAAEESHP